MAGQTYRYAIALLAKSYNQSPELLAEEQVAAYLQDMLERRTVARGTFQTARYAIYRRNEIAFSDIALS